MLVNLLSVLSTFVLAGLLTPDDFGLVAIAAALLEILSAATRLPIGNALIGHADPTEDHYHTAWTLSIIRSVAVGSIFAAAAWPVAAFYQDERLVPVMLAFSISITMPGFANPKLAIFVRNLVFSQDFFLQVSQKIMALLVSLALAFVYHTYWALVAGAVASQLTYVAVSYVLRPHRPRLGLRNWRDLFSFSFWMTLQDFLQTLSWSLDQLLIGAFVGRSALGNYAVGSSMAAVPMREAGVSVTQLLFPGLAHVIGDRDHDRLRSAYVSAQALLMAIILPVGIGIALCAQPAILWFMGAEWRPVVPVIQGLSTIMALQTLGMLAKPLAMAMGRAKSLFNTHLIIFMVYLPLSVAGLLVAGLNGVVAARVFGGMVAIGFNLHLVRRLIALPVMRQILSSGRSLASAGAMAIGGQGLQPYLEALGPAQQLIGTCAIGGLIYMGTHSLLWILAGRGDGPEREVLVFAHRMLGAFRSWRVTR